MASDAVNEQLKPYVLMLRARLRLAEPDQQTDPFYMIPDPVLDDILLGAMGVHNPLYTIQTLPPSELQFVIWLAMIEVYYILATQTAQYYQIGAQGATLNRQQLFEHYSKLVEQLQTKYDKAWERFLSQTVLIQATEVVLPNRFTGRNYRLNAPPVVNLNVVAQSPNSLDLQWVAITDRQITGYRVYQSTTEIIDEFGETSSLISPLAQSIFYTPDVWKTKYRLNNLVSGQIYNIALFVEDVYSRKGWYELSIQVPTVVGTPIVILGTNQSTPTSVN